MNLSLMSSSCVRLVATMLVSAALEVSSGDSGTQVGSHWGSGRTNTEAQISAYETIRRQTGHSGTSDWKAILVTNG